MTHETLVPTFERNDHRGLFQEVLNGGSWESLIFGRMKADGVLGNHYHKKTLIFFYLTKGAVEIKTVNVNSGDKDRFSLVQGQGVILATFESHAIRFTEESEFIMLKSVQYNPEDPDTFSFPVQD